MTNESTGDPKVHVSNVKNKLDDLVKHIQQDETKLQEPRALALFETSREVLKGLMKAFEDYEKKDEKAWKK